MNLRISPVSLECSHQALAPITKSHFASSCSRKERNRDQTVVCQIVLSNPIRSIKFLKYKAFHKCASRAYTMKRSCSANLDEGFVLHHIHIEGLAQGLRLPDDEESEDFSINKGCYAISDTEPCSSKDRGDMFSGNSFWQSQIQLLEPSMLGIRPEPPDWPEREAFTWADIEQRAKSFDLRMIKKKHQTEVGFKEKGGSAYSSVEKAFSSMVFIIVELQSCALQMREALCNEDLELIISQVQRDMHSSFVWLFQQVFSRTPALMVYTMILLANFSVYSTSNSVSIAHNSLLGSSYETTEEIASIQHSTKHLNSNPDEVLQAGNEEYRSVAEVSLWNTLLDEATSLQAGPSGLDLDHDELQKFESPFSVELEADDYMEYLRTDLMYQIGLSQDPNNPLLLCNYAQFLHLVAHDYDRAEECFKRARQAEPPDAESLSRYADFLWTVRNDLWRAEETYLQALSIEPENPYHASKYASFLWNTGGDETCFPLDASNNSSRS